MTNDSDGGSEGRVEVSGDFWGSGDRTKEEEVLTSSVKLSQLKLRSSGERKGTKKIKKID